MKKLAALAVAALSLMVWISCAVPSSALAVDTTLCKANEELCAAGNRYPNGQILKAKRQVWELVMPKAVGTVVCGESKLEGKSTALEAEPLPGQITALTMGMCTLNGVACAVAGIHLPYTTSLGWKGFTTDGQWRWKSSGAGNPGFSVVCGGIVNCQYTAVEPLAELFGGNPASVAVASIKMTGAGGMCPEGKWSAAWEFTEPKPLYVAHT